MPDSARPRAVVTDYDFYTFDPEHAVLDPAGIELVLTQGQSETELIANCAQADALLVEYARITPRVVDALERCQVLVRYGVGYDNFDVAAATAAGIWACNVPDYSLDEVSDHALTLLLALARKIVPLNAAVHAGRWDVGAVKPVYRLQEQTLGIIGYGRIGSNLGRKAAAIGLRVLACDPYLDPDLIRERGAEPVDLEALLRQSDFVSIHAPLSIETRHLIDAESLSLMKSGAYLINTARGPLVDNLALAEALQSGRLAGAALDVTDPEPIPADHPLVGLESCLLTPHAAYYSEQSFVDLKTFAAREVVRVLQGGEPKNPLNPEVRAAAAARRTRLQAG
jgi:D-3-phosphoglycerate dehydrogenase